MKLVYLSMVIGIITLFSISTTAVPISERVEEILQNRHEEQRQEELYSPGRVMRRLGSMVQLLADDAHKIYRRSFEGFSMDELRALIDQLSEGQINIWEQISIACNETGSFDDTDEYQTNDGSDLFTHLISTLELDPDSISVIVSGTDKLAIESKRMEIMMKILDKISHHIKETIEQLAEGQGSWMQRWIIRRIRSALEAMLKAVDSIQSTIEDTELEIIVAGDDDIPDETEPESEEQDEILQINEHIEPEEDELDSETNEDQLWDEENDGRSRRHTVTSQLHQDPNSERRHKRHINTFSNQKYRNHHINSNKHKKSRQNLKLHDIAFGWSLENSELKWTNLQDYRHHKVNKYD